MRPSAACSPRGAAGGGSSAPSSSSSRCLSSASLSSSASKTPLARISPLSLPRPLPPLSPRDRLSAPQARGSSVSAAALGADRRTKEAAAAESALEEDASQRTSRPATRQRRRERKSVRTRAASPSVDASSSSPPPPSSSSSPAGGGSGRDVSASASASAVAAQALAVGGGGRFGEASKRHGEESSTSSATSSSSFSSSSSSSSPTRSSVDQDELDLLLAPRRPLLLRWLPDAETELRTLSFSLNFLLIGVAAASAAGGVAAHSLDALVSTAHAAAEAAEAAAHGGMHDPVTLNAVRIFTPFGLDLLDGASASSLAGLLGAPWKAFASINELHPLRVAAAVSGAVYGLGDLTAQAYEGRGLQDFDAARLLRSSAAGAIAHGPLSSIFYEKLDRFVILSDAFGNGDAWFAPLFKVGVDQTLWAATWNALYLVLLGAMRLESPGVIRNSVTQSGWDVLRAGWRLWPLVHLITYNFIPLQGRLLWVDAVDLGWVSVLAAYAAQRRGREEKRWRKEEERQRGGSGGRVEVEG